MRRPTRTTTAGRAYLDLQRLARQTDGRTDELVTRYVLERFLFRLAGSPHRDRLVLKGGMLLAVFDVRRPTRDVDLLARSMATDVDTVRAVVREVADVVVDDGVAFLTGQTSAEPIREEDAYGGVRVRVPAEVDRARSVLSLDVSTGDPVTPAPVVISYPTLLDEGTFEVVGYPLATVLAEKVETMLRRGAANTRERDYADVWLLLARQEIAAPEFRRALVATATRRGTNLRPLVEAVGDLATARQDAWSAFRTRAGMTAELPERLADVLTGIAGFADPVIADETLSGTWRPEQRTWSR